jgi:hypothetical protein
MRACYYESPSDEGKEELRIDKDQDLLPTPRVEGNTIVIEC